jgi:soluble epoxide hydrolase/lipid-phosphate phosphatase
MSAPYTPPSPAYIPVEEIVRRAPNLGYQAYLADKRSTADIEANLERFVDIVFKPPTADVNFTPEGGLEKALKEGGVSTLPSVLNEKVFIERRFHEIVAYTHRSPGKKILSRPPCQGYGRTVELYPYFQISL